MPVSPLIQALTTADCSAWTVKLSASPANSRFVPKYSFPDAPRAIERGRRGEELSEGELTSLFSETRPEVIERLKSIERTVDSLAVEIERVTEHQRFVTKILSEQRATPPRLMELVEARVGDVDLQVAEASSPPDHPGVCRQLLGPGRGQEEGLACVGIR